MVLRPHCSPKLKKTARPTPGTSLSFIQSKIETNMKCEGASGVTAGSQSLPTSINGVSDAPKLLVTHLNPKKEMSLPHKEKKVCISKHAKKIPTRGELKGRALPHLYQPTWVHKRAPNSIAQRSPNHIVLY